jgi:hypothetical protein
MEWLKSVTGKVVTGLVALAVVAGGISWWSMTPDTREQVLASSGKILGWVGIVLAVPWASFFLIGKVSDLDNNLAGAALVLALTVVELVVLAWMFQWGIRGSGAWTAFVVGGLFAGVYNLFTCDWIAEKVG